MKNKQLLFSTFLGVMMASSAYANADDTAIAMVNNHQITKADVASEMSAVPAKLVAGRQDEIEKAIVERLIQKRLVMEEAERLEIEKDKSFQAQMAALRENLIFNYVLSNRIEQEVTPERVRAHYEDNIDDYTQAAAKIRHILVATKEEAENIIEQLDDGADFAKLAQELSTGPSATRGGDLGWVSPGEMVPRFEEAAFDLKANSFSKKPVKTQFGWHVIFVEDKDDARKTPFAEVEERIQQKLSEDIVENYLTELKEKAEIRYEAN